jgi:NADPH-dependent 2,4-dienoyl-CoA reductase/sulfur reductase-like enzyme
VNRRTDEYGGSLTNRLRFTFEVLEAIRAAIGDDLVVGLRMIGDEDQPGGLSREESIEIAVLLASSGLLDFLNVAGPSLATDDGLAKAIPPSGTPLMPYLQVAAAVKEAVDLPVLHATRMTDLSSARHAISEGLIDLAGMTRAHMADPHIVAKLERGEADRIRVCVGAAYCINRLHLGMESVCIQNPATGRESTVPQLVVRTSGPRKRVVVVGAGPGGLEAARTCAERGHDVVLFEAQDRVGGQMVLMARASQRQLEVAGIVDWLAAEIGHAGVELRLSSPVDAVDVLAEDPDVVVIATGGRPEIDFLESGADLVHTSWEVLAGAVRPAGRILVFDDHGAERGLSVVEYLVDRGAVGLEVVTPDRHVGFDLATPPGPAYLRMLYGHGVLLTPDHRLVAVEHSGDVLRATLRNGYTRAEVVREVDSVVVEHGVVPDGSLFEELRDGSANEGVVDLDALLDGGPQPAPADGYALFRVGDAVASRDVASAIYEARRLLQSL